MGGNECSCIRVDANAGSLLKITEAGGESYTMEISEDVLRSNGTICVCEGSDSYKDVVYDKVLDGTVLAKPDMARLIEKMRVQNKQIMEDPASVAVGAAGAMSLGRPIFWILAVAASAVALGDQYFYARNTYDRSGLLENLVGGATNAFDREITIEYTDSTGKTHMLNCIKNHLILPSPGDSCEIGYMTKEAHRKDHQPIHKKAHMKDHQRIHEDEEDDPEYRGVLVENKVRHERKWLNCTGFVIHDFIPGGGYWD